VRAAIEGSISSFWPASVLQTHPDVSFFVDGGSASKLSLLDYYAQVREHDRRMSDRE